MKLVILPHFDTRAPENFLMAQVLLVRSMHICFAFSTLLALVTLNPHKLTALTSLAVLFMFKLLNNKLEPCMLLPLPSPFL